MVSIFLIYKQFCINGEIFQKGIDKIWNSLYNIATILIFLKGEGEYEEKDNKIIGSGNVSSYLGL